MDAFLAMFWLIGQILSVVALCVGLVLSILYWGLRDAVPRFVPEKDDSIDEAIARDRMAGEAVATRDPVPAMSADTYEQLAQLSGEPAEEARPPLIHFPPGQGPRPAAPA
jgi:hypothetical protein